LPNSKLGKNRRHECRTSLQNNRFGIIYPDHEITPLQDKIEGKDPEVHGSHDQKCDFIKELIGFITHLTETKKIVIINSSISLLLILPLSVSTNLEI
jgi:hypothetical protein